MPSDQNVKRSKTGVTIIDLLFLAVLVSLAAAILFPSFSGMKVKTKSAILKANMRMTQAAAESYALENDGCFPVEIPDGKNSFSTFFPGGDPDENNSGQPPRNPFTGEANWTDFVPIEVADVYLERATPPDRAVLSGNGPGRIGYAALGFEGERGYAIEASDETGRALSGLRASTTLVLSNF